MITKQSPNSKFQRHVKKQQNQLTNEVSGIRRENLILQKKKKKKKKKKASPYKRPKSTNHFKLKI
jgi:hypothetical protein